MVRKSAKRVQKDIAMMVRIATITTPTMMPMLIALFVSVREDKGGVEDGRLVDVMDVECTGAS